MKTLILGAAIVDVLLKVPNLPIQGGDVYVEDKTIQVGGCAFNVASVMKKLKANYSLCAPIGMGMWSRIVEMGFIEQGHKILIKDNEMDNGNSITLIEPSGERTFITELGIEDDFKEKWFIKINLDQYDSIYVDGYRVSSKKNKEVLEFVQRNSFQNFFFAPGPMIKNIEIIDQIFDLNPIVHLNERELTEFTGISNWKEALKKLHKITRNTVFVTLGKKGVSLINENKINFIPSIGKVNIIDTVGAGDSHIATIMSLWKSGLNLERICYFANKLASKVVSIQGSIIYDEKFIEKFNKEIFSCLAKNVTSNKE